MSFQDDIKGKNTQLFPVVEIDGIWYSTNNVTIDGNYCKPILMNIPSIKESVDIESRKFKISNVSLQFNNFPFDGVRFSDQLSASSLINTEATIYFKSPSTTTINTNVATDLPEVYKGIIRRISHDDTSVKVELEDLTEKNAHKDLPQESLGDGDNVPDKYKNKPIPMVYGEVNRSPVVFSQSTSQMQIDYKPIQDLVESSNPVFGTKITESYGIPALFAYIDDNYVGILEKVIEPIEIENANANISDPSFITGVVDTIQYDIDDNLINIHLNNNYFALNTLQCLGFFKISNFQAYEIGNESFPLTDFSIDDPTLMVDDYLTTYMPLDAGYIDAPTGFSIGLSPFSMISFKIFLYPKFKFTGFVFRYAINGSIFGSDDTSTITQGDDYTGLFYFDPDSSSPKDILWNVQYPYGNANSYGASERQIKVYPQYVNDEGYFFISFNGGINPPVSDDSDGESSSTYEATVSGKLKDSECEAILLPENIFTQNFYANVKGRINTNNENFGELNNTNLNEDEFFENPIDIIYDLVRSELGHDSIGEAEYAEAKAQHKLSDGSDWKFGFTVNKRINSKKLIEEIAKSTKCFPKFKNDGTFGFNTIKDNYDVANDYAGATPIKESEVISYSFKKTKPEQIYKKVDVQYKKDYAQDSFLKRTDPIYTGTNTGGFDENNEPIWTADYYGIGNSKETYLEFESPYIRHDETADALAKFLSEQYRNDHLLFNLKLPLQYINLEIGDLVKFEDLFQGLKAYGIDYRVTQDINIEDSQQTYFPLFMVTSTKKNLDSVQIECMQLHFLNTGANYVSTDWNYVNAMFPDDEGNVVVIDQVFVPNAPVISGVNDLNFTTTLSEYFFEIPHATAIDGDEASTDISDLVEIIASWGETYTNTQNNSVTLGGGDYSIIYKVTSPTSGISTEIIVSVHIGANEPPYFIANMNASNTGAINFWGTQGTNTTYPQNEPLPEFTTNENNSPKVHLIQREGQTNNWIPMAYDYYQRYVFEATLHPDYGELDAYQRDINLSGFDNNGNVANYESQTLYGNACLNWLNVQGHLTGDDFFMWRSRLVNLGTITLHEEIDDNGIYSNTVEFGAGDYPDGYVGIGCALIYDNSNAYHFYYWYVYVYAEREEIPDSNFMLGDGNLDGTVNILDIVGMVNYILGGVDFTGELGDIYDMNGDGGVNILDVVQMVQIVLNG